MASAGWRPTVSVEQSGLSSVPNPSGEQFAGHRAHTQETVGMKRFEWQQRIQRLDPEQDYHEIYRITATHEFRGT